MCLYPKLITNPKYLPNKKNNYEVTQPKDKRIKMVAIGCGKCIECRRKKIREWMVRIEWEERTTRIRGRTITLTFDEASLDKLPSDANEAAAEAIRLFLKRWDKEKHRTIRHWFVTELGKEATERLHLHGIVWETDYKDIQRIWGYGNVKFGDKYGNDAVTERAIRYMTKYIMKPNEKDPNWMGKIFASKGIGKAFKNSETAKRLSAKGKDAPQYLKLKSGVKIDIPIYYRNKIFTEEEREDIWIKLLDKEERYVMGQKFDVSTLQGDIEYEKALAYQQKENERLGYPKQPWSKKKYKKNRKILQKYFEH